METALPSLQFPTSDVEAPMVLERISEKILEALKVAITETQEHRLFQFGKLPGLFKTRTGISAEAALAAIKLGLLETTRTEAKGKLFVEWVRATPAAVRYVNEHESPKAQLLKLRNELSELTRRVDMAIHRIEAQECRVPWRDEAIKYLDQRESSLCPLKELFEAICEAHGTITLAEFYEGLRRIHDQRVVKLTGGQHVDPEFAMIVGTELCSFVER